MAQPRLTGEFKKAYHNLNPEQKSAVDTIDGPVLVIAGPGTGKTQVLSLRTANILAKTDTDASAILALTFTESGARTMRERLVKMIGNDGYYVVISTFHSFCDSIIKENPDRFATHEESEPLSDLERIHIFSKIIDENSFRVLKPVSAPHLYIRSLIRTIQLIKREGYKPESFKEFIEKYPFKEEKEAKKMLEVASVFRLYQKSLSDTRRYDFEDMINKVTDLFEEDQEFLLRYEERFQYLLVDEYQDTNSSQNKLLFQLASYYGPQANIFAVGDPDQAIYRFQGASLSNMLEFKERFPSTKIVFLKKNYRSQQTILDAAHSLIMHNNLNSSDITGEPEEPLVSQLKSEKTKIQIATFPSQLVEYAFIGEKIKELIKNGVPANEIAVVYRDNRDANDIADILGRLGLRYNLEGGDDVLKTGDTVRLLTIMRTVESLRTKSENLNLFTILNYSFIGCDSLDVLKIARFASEKRMSYLDAIEGEEIESYGIRCLPDIQKFIVNLHVWGQKDAEQTFTETFEMILNQSGLLDWILKQPNSIRRLNRINSLFRQVKQLNQEDYTLNLNSFLKNIDLMLENGLIIPEDDLDIDVNAIRLSTAHKIKGQEYRVVFLVKVYDGKWSNKVVREMIKLPPELISHTEVDKKEKNEDERRLFYVGLTRAKQTCFITRSKEYDDKETIDAMFTQELDEKVKENYNTSPFQNHADIILKDVLKTQNHDHVTEEEKDFLNQVIANFVLSPTALNSYLDCPYAFKLNNLLRVPKAKTPSLSFGSAMHEALEKFNTLFKIKKTVPQLDDLLKIYNEALKNQILTPDQFDVYLEQGREALTKYYLENKGSLLPLLRTEWKIGTRTKPVVWEGVPLTGFVDKVEIIDQKNKLARLVDYKTGRPKSRNEIEGKTKAANGSYKRQLVFYQLLADLDHRRHNSLAGYKIAETQLDFLETTESGKFKKESFIITSEEIEELKAQIKEVMKKIRNHEFPAVEKCNLGEKCEFCSRLHPDGTLKLY